MVYVDAYLSVMITPCRVGRRSHTLEVIFGFRTCDNDGIAYKCADDVAHGAWGPSRVTVDESTVRCTEENEEPSQPCR